MNYRLIIFDLDGTLVNTITDLAYACNHALEACGYKPYRVEDYPRMVGNGIYRLMSRALKAQGIDAEADSEQVEEMTPIFKDYYNHHLTDHSVAYDGITEMLEDLQNKGVLLAVASNKYQQATEQIIRMLFPSIHFTAILGQRDGIAKKPDPQIVYEIIDIANSTQVQAIVKEDVLYVGDSHVDQQTAENAGVEYKLVNWGFESQQDDDPHVICSPAELLNKQRTIR